jgi:hypothetical protein
MGRLFLIIKGIWEFMKCLLWKSVGFSQGTWPFGADGILNVTSGTTVVSAGSIKDYSSVNVSVGATLEISGGSNAWTIFGCRGNFVNNGTILVKGIADGTYATTAPDLFSLNKTVTSGAGGAGGATGAGPDPQGGAAGSGNGGGGAGGCVVNNSLPSHQHGSAGSAGATNGGNGGAGANTSNGGAGSSTSGVAGSAGGAGTVDGGAGTGTGAGGGGGGKRGYAGALLYVRCTAIISGNGTVTLSGEAGGAGGNGGAGTWAEYSTPGEYVSADGGSGAGGAGGGGGGHFIVRTTTNSQTWSVGTSAGGAGSGGSKGTGQHADRVAAGANGSAGAAGTAGSSSITTV